MNVLMINGSPHKQGNTYIALREMEKTFEEEGIQTEIIHVGNQAVSWLQDVEDCLLLLMS